MIGKLLQTVSVMTLSVAAGYYLPASARPPESPVSAHSGTADAGIKPPAQLVKSAAAPIGVAPAKITAIPDGISAAAPSRKTIAKPEVTVTNVPGTEDVADVDVPAEDEIANAYDLIDDDYSDSGYSFDDGPVDTTETASFIDLSRDGGIDRADLEANGGWSAGISADSSSALVGVSSVGVAIAANEEADGESVSAAFDDSGLDGSGDVDVDSSGSGGGTDDGVGDDNSGSGGGDDGAEHDSGDDHGGSSGGGDSGGGDRSGSTGDSGAGDSSGSAGGDRSGSGGDSGGGGSSGSGGGDSGGGDSGGGSGGGGSDGGKGRGRGGDSSGRGGGDD